ncbi:serine/threonine-protein kinase H1-like [Petromyzon marinus]|uniref:serine/threonine-protein kinase H1-like n=1 Tax=Petromyzon marinus TaxID=7757 RepID=UPI003F72F4EA
MGCAHSKILPDCPKGGQVDFVKTATSGVEKQRSKEGRTKGGRTKDKQFDDPCLLKAAAALAAGDGGDIGGEYIDPSSRKVAKYRAKFDARVTAKYDLKALIGRGSFSSVVRAEHRSSRQPYAIKLVETSATEGREACACELAVLRRVRHPNVVQLIEVFETPTRTYLVMELATGGELFDRILARGSFTERDAARALSMLLEGARYLHALGIAHRDLKPENLLYYHPGADSRLFITDFGLAGNVRAGQGHGQGQGRGHEENEDGPESCVRTACGTPEYMPPEVLSRRGAFTQAVDMWAIGVISYILLSGTMPFEEETRSRLFRAILRGKYSYVGEPWPSVSNVAKDFVDGLLKVEPTERLSAAQALRHPWVACAVSPSSVSSSTSATDGHAAAASAAASAAVDPSPAGGCRPAASSASSASSHRNLQRSISQNLAQRRAAGSRAQSSRSVASGRSRGGGGGVTMTGRHHHSRYVQQQQEVEQY